MREVVARVQDAGFVLKIHSGPLEAPVARQYERLARGHMSRQVRERPAPARQARERVAAGQPRAGWTDERTQPERLGEVLGYRHGI